MWFGACGVGPSWVFGVRTLYKRHRRINLGKKLEIVDR